MLLYSIIMILVSMLFFALSIAIYRGKTALIHDYHQTKVTDQAAYGKAFGKALGVIALSMLLSGVTGLLGDAASIGPVAIIILVIGLGIGIGCIVAVQHKYNQGIF